MLGFPGTRVLFAAEERGARALLEAGPARSLGGAPRGKRVLSSDDASASARRSVRPLRDRAAARPSAAAAALAGASVAAAEAGLDAAATAAAHAHAQMRQSLLQGEQGQEPAQPPSTAAPRDHGSCDAVAGPSNSCAAEGSMQQLPAAEGAAGAVAGAAAVVPAGDRDVDLEQGTELAQDSSCQSSEGEEEGAWCWLPVNNVLF